MHRDGCNASDDDDRRRRRFGNDQYIPSHELKRTEEPLAAVRHERERDTVYEARSHYQACAQDLVRAALQRPCGPAPHDVEHLEQQRARLSAVVTKARELIDQYSRDIDALNAAWARMLLEHVRNGEYTRDGHEPNKDLHMAYALASSSGL